MLNVLKPHIPKIIVSLILLLFGKLIFGIENYIPAHILNKLSTILLLKISMSLFLLFLGLVAYSILFYMKTSKKVKIEDYLFQEDLGYYVHKINEGAFCQRCLLSGIPARLSIIDKDSWRCRNCDNKKSSFRAV